MFVVRFASGVILDPVTPAHVRILRVLDDAANAIEHDLTVTCGREGHTGGQHPRGLALDVRTKDLTPLEILGLYHACERDLDRSFYFQYEVTKSATGMLANIAVLSASASAEHFHIQVRKGLETWPEVQPREGVSTVA